MAIDKVKVVKLDTKPASNALKELRDQLKEARAAMLSAEEGTDEYNDALMRAADASHELREQQERIKGAAADSGQIFKNVTSIVGGMVGAYQAAQAAMNLMGVENEDIMESMKKMQDLMALTQAFTPIKQGVDAFKDLKNAISAATGATSKFGRALVATGLGAIVALLGYAVTHLDEISTWLDDITGQTDVLGTTIAALQAAWDTAGTAIIGGLKLIGKAVKDYVTMPFRSVINAIEAYNNTEGTFGDKIVAAVKAMGGTVKETFTDIVDDAKEYGQKVGDEFGDSFNNHKTENAMSKAKKAAEEYIKTVKEAASIQEKAAEGRYNRAIYWANKEVALEKEIQLKQLEAERKRLKDLMSLNESQRQQIQEQASKQTYQPVRDMLEQEANQLLGQYNRYQGQLNETEASIRRIAEEVKNLYNVIAPTTETTKPIAETAQAYGTVKEAIEANKKALEELKAAEEEVLDDDSMAMIHQGDLLREQGKMYESYVDSVVENARRMAFEQGLAYDEDLKALQKALEQKKITEEEYIRYSDMLNKQHHVTEMQAWTTTMSNIGDIMDSIGSMVDQSTEEGQNRYKGIMTTSIIMSTLAGIAGAISSAFMPVNSGMSIFGQIAMAASTSASILASGIAQLVQLHKVNENSSLGANTLTTPTMSGMGSVVAPVQYTQDVQGASIEGAIGDQRVYVLESDISGTQRRVNVAEGEARY